MVEEGVGGGAGGAGGGAEEVVGAEALRAGGGSRVWGIGGAVEVEVYGR